MTEQWIGLWFTFELLTVGIHSFLSHVKYLNPRGEVLVPSKLHWNQGLLSLRKCPHFSLSAFTSFCVFLIFPVLPWNYLGTLSLFQFLLFQWGADGSHRVRGRPCPWPAVPVCPPPCLAGTGMLVQGVLVTDLLLQAKGTVAPKTLSPWSNLGSGGASKQSLTWQWEAWGEASGPATRPCCDLW